MVVSSRPRPVSATISGTDRPLPPVLAVMIRLSTPGASGSPQSRADCRVVTSPASSPSRIQSVGPNGSPLSNMDDWSSLARVMTNGAQATSAAPGSLDRLIRTGLSPLSRSPRRGPPPGRLNTERPAAARRPEKPSQNAYTYRSATEAGGRIVSYRPAGSATARFAQS